MTFWKIIVELTFWKYCVIIVYFKFFKSSIFLLYQNFKICLKMSLFQVKNGGLRRKTEKNYVVLQVIFFTVLNTTFYMFF